jgi:hypothetical protein
LPARLPLGLHPLRKSPAGTTEKLSRHDPGFGGTWNCLWLTFSRPYGTSRGGFSSPNYGWFWTEGRIFAPAYWVERDGAQPHKQNDKCGVLRMAHCRSLGYARDDKKERVVERERTVT